ncbi:TonB-dependent receptor [Frigoriflavimonas asaccharolytica]
MNSYAQSFTVQGIVKDFHDKTPLKGATIKIGSQTTTSDLKGFFKFNSVKKGNYTLEANHTDCDQFIENIAIDENKSVEILLEHHAQDIETVVIHGNHKNTGSLVMKTLSKDQIAQNSTENLGNLLTQISGVGTLKTGNNIAKPIIHGLYGSRVAIINNGVKLAEQEWGVEHAPNIDVNNFEHIDVIKGASALKYGSDAVGGVIVLEPSILPKKDTLQGAINLSGISNGQGLATDIKLSKTWENGWGIRANGGYKKLGDLSAPDYNLQNTGLESSSFSFGVQNISFKQGISFDYYGTNQEIGILRSSHISSAEDFAAALSQQEPLFQRDFTYDIDNPKQDVQHHIAKISAFKRFENLGKISATYSFQYNHRKEFDIRRGEDLSKIPSLDLELITNDFNVNHLFEREKYSIESGVNASYQNNYSSPLTETRRLVPNYDRYAAGVYSVFKYKISPQLNAEAGARYDYTFFDIDKYYNLSDWNQLYATQFPQFEVRVNQNRILTNPKLTYQNFSYNAGLEFRPSDNFNLKFNYARIGRTPNIAELAADGLHHSAAIIEKGNLAIENERGSQFNLVAEVKLPVLSGLDITVNPYYFDTKNFINQVPSGYQNTQFGAFVIYQYEQIDAKMYGLDVDLNLKITPELSLISQGSYVHGQDETNDVPLILMLPTNFRNSLQYKSSGKSNFFVNVNNTTFLKQNRFPRYDISVQLFDNQGEAYEQPVDISTPPNGYTLWNAKAGVNLSKNLSTIFTVDNILNTKYRDYLNRLRYFSDEMGRNFTLTFNYKF